MNCAPSTATEFNKSYLTGLLDGDPEIEKHFAAYFSQELDCWLKGQLRTAAAIEDVRQETLRRVLETMYSGKVLQRPEQLPCFIRGVCKRVLLEYWRKAARSAAQEDVGIDLTDRFDPEQAASAAESRSHLQAAMMALPSKSRQLLTMLYFEDQDRAEVSRKIGVDQNYLRVMIYRATARLRTHFFAAGF